MGRLPAVGGGAGVDYQYRCTEKDGGHEAQSNKLVHEREGRDRPFADPTRAFASARRFSVDPTSYNGRSSVHLTDYAVGTGLFAGLSPFQGRALDDETANPESFVDEKATTGHPSQPN